MNCKMYRVLDLSRLVGELSHHKDQNLKRVKKSGASFIHSDVPGPYTEYVSLTTT